jgi:hypothetical protein
MTDVLVEFLNHRIKIGDGTTLYRALLDPMFFSSGLGPSLPHDLAIREDLSVTLLGFINTLLVRDLNKWVFATADHNAKTILKFESFHDEQEGD